jgi:hypothetical protein
MDAPLEENSPTQEEQELRAIEGVQDDDENAIVDVDQDTHEPLGGEASTEGVGRRSRSRSQELARGRVVAAAAANPYGDTEDVCGVCLENHGDDAMVALWCCKNILCIYDARKIGACPFCREEPLIWNLRVMAS